MSIRRQTLFAQSSLSGYLNQRRRLAEEFILKMDAATFASIDPDELIEQAVSQFDIEVPKLDRENRTTQSSKTPIDARTLSHRPVIDRGRPLPIPAVTIFFRVPFSGDGALLTRFPSKFTNNRPTGQIDGNELILDYTFHLADQEPDPSQDEIEQRFRDELNQIQRWLKWIREDVEEYRETLTQLLRSVVEKRQTDDQKLSAALEAFGISEPIREKHDRTLDSPQDLTYIEWCDRVLTCLIEEEGKSSTTRHMGVEFNFLADALFSRPVRSNTPEVDALVQAISELVQLGFIVEGATRRSHKSTRTGRDHVRDPEPFRQTIRATMLDEVEERLVREVNERSHQPGKGYATTEIVGGTKLEWNDQDELWAVGKRLEQEYRFLADGPYIMRGARFRSTYRGLIWGFRMSADLLPEQEDLLQAMVEAAQRQPRERRSAFIFGESHDGAFLMHNGFPDGEHRIYSGDFVALRNAGLLNHISGHAYDVSPSGYRVYEHLKQRSKLRRDANESAVPHVFISYVREDADVVDCLRSELEETGVKVWIDREHIGAGQRWKAAIRRAIRRGGFFIACFSTNYQSRSKTFMNEELTIAIEELRQRPTDHAWFIPVLLTACEVPDRDIGAGETLRDLQDVRLFEDWNRGVQQIVTAVRSEHPG